MPLSSWTSAQITPPRCLLPILLIGAREDAPAADETLTTEQGVVTSTRRFPAFERLETLDGFFCKVVPATGWRRSNVGEQEEKHGWDNETVVRLYQTNEYEIRLQDYRLFPDPSYYPQDDYYFDFAVQDIEKVFRLPYRWMIGIEEFEGYESMSYLTRHGLCFPINPNGPQPQVSGEKADKGTKQCKITVTPRFPNFTFPS